LSVFELQWGPAAIIATVDPAESEENNRKQMK